MEKYKLVFPDRASGDVKKIYDDIIKHGGKGFLVPVLGFLANDPVVLHHIWELLKHLEFKETATPKKILIGIAMVGAQRIGCDRCITFHEVDLIKRGEISQEDADKIRNYEEEYKSGNISEPEYVGLKFGEKMVLGVPVPEEEWERINKYYSQKQIYEMIMVAWIESGFSRYGTIMPVYDESIDWPRDFTPSEHYGEVITK